MPDAERPRRSVLYLPSANARAIEKAASLPVDALILDLEDAVAPEEKGTARTMAAEAVAARRFGYREVVVRINALASSFAPADIAAIVPAAPDAILVPKVSRSEDIRRMRAALRAAGASPEIAVWAMIETPLAILNAGAIAAAAREDGASLTALVIGTNDLAAETRAQLVPGRAPLLAALSTVAIAARAFGLTVLDGVYNDFRDEEGFRLECDQGRQFGMDGKTLIHPNQVATANEVFSPSADEVAWALAVIAAFERPENEGKGVLNIDGRMVELLHAEEARRTVDLARLIRERETS